MDLESRSSGGARPIYGAILIGSELPDEVVAESFRLKGGTKNPEALPSDAYFASMGLDCM